MAIPNGVGLCVVVDCCNGTSYGGLEGSLAALSIGTDVAGGLADA